MSSPDWKHPYYGEAIMNNTPRPTLDPVTIWRAEQVAKSEGRSLANAIARLVEEAWGARLEAMRRAAAPNMKISPLLKSAEI